MKRQLLIFVIVCFFSHAYGHSVTVCVVQKYSTPRDTIFYDGNVKTKTHQNSVFAELAGNAFLGSINYDRITKPLLLLSPVFKMSFRLGIAPNPREDFSIPLAPIVEMNLLFGRRKHYFEGGIGLTFFAWNQIDSDKYGNQTTTRNKDLLRTLRLGYRFQKPTGGFLFRAALTPILGDNEVTYSDIFMWGGLSLGYCF